MQWVAAVYTVQGVLLSRIFVCDLNGNLQPMTIERQFLPPFGTWYLESIVVLAALGQSDSRGRCST